MEGRWCLIFITITVAAITILSVKLLNRLWFRPRYLEKFLRNQGLNGTPYRPFYGDKGDLDRIMKREGERRIQVSDDITPRVFGFYMEIVSKFGPNSFWWSGPDPWLNIVDPEMIKEILMKYDVFEKGITGASKFLAGGVASLEGEQWKERRKIINPAFYMERVKNMIPAIGWSCSDMLRKWEAMVSCSNEGRCEIDVWPFLEDLAGDVISRTAFGSSIEEGRRIFELQREKTRLTIQLLRYSFIPGWRHVPTKSNRRLKAVLAELQSIIRVAVEKRRDAMESGEVEAIRRDDLLGTLMEPNSQGARMSSEDVIEECEMFYSAGSETNSCLMVWTMVLLCQHPEWQTRAREEVLQVFGKSHPAPEGLHHLKTVTMILQEVLRLYAPQPFIFRLTKETVKLGNITIPKGVYLNLLTGLLHYDPKLWGEDAKEFKPERFSQGVSNAAKTQSSFVPFGSGPRVCIGQNLAMAEAKMTLAMILQRFSFEFSPSYTHSPSAFLITSPQFGAPLILRNVDSFSSS